MLSNDASQHCYTVYFVYLPFPSALLQSALFLRLTFVVRMQMQSILTSPASELSPRHLPAATCTMHSPACCFSVRLCLLLLPLFFHHSIYLSSLPHVIFTCPFIGASREDFYAKSRGGLGNMAAVPVHLSPPSCFPAAICVLWQLVATF